MKGPLAGTVANGSCSGGTAGPLPAPASAPALGKQHWVTACHRPRLTCTLPVCKRKIIRKEDVRYGQTAPGPPMSRSEVCCCIAGSETCRGLLLHGKGNLPPNLPTSGCSQGGNMHCGCCAALYHCQRRAFGAVELWRKPASVPCLPARRTALDRQRSRILETPRIPRAERLARAPQQARPAVPATDRPGLHFWVG